MFIDFHTHIFPPAIAPRTVEALRAGAKRIAGVDMQAHTDATDDGLRASMKRHGVDLSLVMPIATKPSQTENINRYAKEVSQGGLLSFGSLQAGVDHNTIPESAVIKGSIRCQDEGTRAFLSERLGEIAAAIIELKPDTECTVEEIEKFCADMPRYKRPKKIIFATVPRNPTGKIEKPKLREIYCGKSLVEAQTTR